MTAPYSKAKKLRAVVLADQLGSAEAAARQLGIPPRSVQRWQTDPDMAEFVAKTREELADDIKAFAALAWSELVKRVREHDIDTRDLIVAAGVAIDKSQLLAGGATSRTESRTLTEGLSDHEREALAEAIDAWIADRPAPARIEGDQG